MAGPAGRKMPAKMPAKAPRQRMRQTEEVAYKRDAMGIIHRPGEDQGRSARIYGTNPKPKPKGTRRSGR